MCIFLERQQEMLIPSFTSKYEIGFLKENTSKNVLLFEYTLLKKEYIFISPKRHIIFDSNPNFVDSKELQIYNIL